MKESKIFSGDHYLYWAEEAKSALLEKELWQAVETPEKATATQKTLALGLLSCMMNYKVRSSFPDAQDASSHGTALP